MPFGDTNEVRSEGRIADLKNHIRVLEETIEEGRERRSIERRKTRDEIQNLNDQLSSLNVTNHDQAEMLVEDEKKTGMLESSLESKIAQLNHLKSRPWWQVLLRRGL